MSSPLLLATIALFGFSFAVSVVAKPLAGTAYDRVGLRTSLAGVILPRAVRFGLLPFVEAVWSLVGITALISTTRRLVQLRRQGQQNLPDFYLDSVKRLY